MGSVKGIGVLLPLLVTAMLVLCPVFFSLDLPGNLQFFLPPTYYIYAGYHPMHLVYLLLYTAAGASVYFLAGLIRKQS
jgi:hypothetical protein